jgi:hypothetical protein
MGKKIIVRDKFQDNYSYELSEPEGKNFNKEFTPDLTPHQMLELGVFGGEYFADKPNDIPASWLKHTKLSSTSNPELNFFEIGASQPLQVWQEKGWIDERDPRGWFQWYCRYYLGRRIPEYDQWQIKRWKAIRRHIGQIKKHCHVGDITCRRKQRQALLHWAYDSRKL